MSRGSAQRACILNARRKQSPSFNATAICDTRVARESIVKLLFEAGSTRILGVGSMHRAGLVPSTSCRLFMNHPRPKLSAPALQANVVPTRALKHMGRPDAYDAHWLFAGPGAGKTQLARLWIQQLGRPYAWLQLDPQDNDPLLLLEQLRLALAPLVHPQVILPRFAPQSGVSLQRHCEYLWQMLLSTLRAPCVLVLDDAHHIADWRKHPVLHSMMTGLDLRVHQLILSRADIEDTYVRDVVNRRIHRVHPSSFRWQSPQLRAWVKQRWGISDLQEGTANALLTLSQGRAAILALLDIQAMLQNPRSLTKNAAKQLELSDLMESALLSQLSPEERDSLFFLACLGSFPRAWLRTLGFPPVVQGCIKMWQASSSVVHSLEQGKDELRFHPLFAEILRGSNEAGNSHASELRDRIIDACVAKGRILDAIALCRNTHCWRKYWELLARVGLDWIEQGQLGSLAGALLDLPPKVLQEFRGPTLSLFLAVTSLNQDPALAYRQAIDALQGSHEVPRLRPVWANALAIAAQAVVASGLHLGHLEPLTDAIDAAIEQPWFLESPAQIRLLALQAGLIASMSGQNRPPMKRLYWETERAIAECTNTDIELATVSALARVLVLHGLPEYLDSVQQHVARAEHLVRSPAAELNLLHAKLHCAQAKGKYAKSERFARMLWNGREKDLPLIWVAEALASGAFGAACSQNLPQVSFYSQQLSLLRAQCNDSSVNFRMHDLIYKACSAAHAGHWRDASGLYHEAKQTADTYRYSIMQVATRCCLATVCIELNQLPEAEALTQDVEELLNKFHIPLLRNFLSALRAFIAIRQAPTDRAILALDLMLQHMENPDHFVQVVAMLPQYAEMLSFGLEHKVRPDLIRRIIRRGNIYPKTRPHPDWPSFIEVQVFGRFEIRINGKDARSKLVSSGRRFELLTALLWWGGQKLSYEQCAQWIWHHIPEPARAIRSIKTALKRLNEDFGRDDAILDEQGLISINPELWSYDATQLLQALGTHGHSPALLNQVNRGFIGPTPIPTGLRSSVPSRGAIELGPEPLLAVLGLPRWKARTG